MNPEPIKLGDSSTDAEKHKQLDHEVREMVSALTHRLASLQQVHKPGSSRPEDEDEHGVRIITLAGSNTGASMRGDLDEKSGGPDGVSVGDEDALNAYVNSNFQAINNSIMMGGSYNTNDPGVHMEIADVVEQRGHSHKPDRHGKKGKKKDKEISKSDQHTDHTD